MGIFAMLRCGSSIVWQYRQGDILALTKNKKHELKHHEYKLELDVTQFFMLWNRSGDADAMGVSSPPALYHTVSHNPEGRKFKLLEAAKL